ncbi:MAG: bestrophin family ion channel [Gemmatales bacterium]
MSFITKWLKLHFILAIAVQLAFWLGLVLIYCIVIWLIESQFNIKLGEMGAEVGLINTIILSLLMSFRNRTAYERWWEGRRLWGQLVNDSRNLASKLVAYVPPEAIAQSELSILLTGFPFALKKHLRGDAFTLQQIPGFERSTDQPKHVPLYLAQRLIALVTTWRRAGHLDYIMFRNVDSHLNAMLDVCGACERIMNTPIPFSYKAMLRTGLVLHLLIAPWYTISTLGIRGIPVLLLVCFFLLGVELIDSHIEDPFGHDEDDLDLEKYAETIRESVCSILAN